MSVSGSAGSQSCKRTEFVALEVGQPFNAFHLLRGIFVPDALVWHHGLSPTAKLLWARLARHARANRREYPSVPTLAAELGLSDRQVQRGLAALEREGFVRRDLRKTAKGEHTSTAYVFLWHQIFAGAGAVLAREKPTRKKGVVTDIPLGGEGNVTTKTKKRPEEKTSSSSPPASPPPSPNSKKLEDDKFVSEKAERKDLICQSTGQASDRRLIRDIAQGPELRRIELREYLNDIPARLERLRLQPSPGSWRDALPTEKPGLRAHPTHSQCPNCSGVGRTAAGYCDCAMGRDLGRVESRAT